MIKYSCAISYDCNTNSVHGRGLFSFEIFRSKANIEQQLIELADVLCVH